MSQHHGEQDHNGKCTELHLIRRFIPTWQPTSTVSLTMLHSISIIRGDVNRTVNSDGYIRPIKISRAVELVEVVRIVEIVRIMEIVILVEIVGVVEIIRIGGKRRECGDY